MSKIREDVESRYPSPPPPPSPNGVNKSLAEQKEKKNVPIFQQKLIVTLHIQVTCKFVLFQNHSLFNAT